MQASRTVTARVFGLEPGSHHAEGIMYRVKSVPARVTILSVSMCLVGASCKQETPKGVGLTELPVAEDTVQLAPDTVSGFHAFTTVAGATRPAAVRHYVLVNNTA